MACVSFENARRGCPYAGCALRRSYAQAALVDGIQRLVPPSDGSDDFVRIGCPREGLWVGVGLSDVPVDGGLKIDHRMEHSPLKPLPGELGEEALDSVEPGT